MDHDRDFTDFASARWSALVRSAVFLGCTTEEAQDLAQHTLLRCYTSWRKVQRAGDQDAYLYRMLLNALRDARRRRWRNERPTATLPDRGRDDQTHHIDVADAVDRALRELSPANREAVVLRYYAHLSEQQTAQVLGIAPGTVKSRVSRALAQLATSTHLKDLTEGPIR